MTANAMEGNRERCLAAGMDDYVVKPFRFDELAASIDRWAGGAGCDVPLVAPAPDPPKGESEPVNAAGLAALRSLATDDAPDFMRELIELFLADLGPKVETLREAAEQRDALTLASAAHSLKGSASNLAAPGLADLTSRVERLARRAELAEVPALVELIRLEAERVRTWLEREVVRP